MKQYILLFSLLILLVGCSGDNTEEVTKETKTEQLTNSGDSEENDNKVNEEETPTGLGLKPIEFVERYNEILTKEMISEDFHLNESLNNENTEVEALIDDDGIIEKISIEVPGFPSPFLKAIIGSFSPAVEEGNMNNILSFDFGLLGGKADFDKRDHQGVSHIGDINYKLETINLEDRIYKITVTSDK